MKKIIAGIVLLLSGIGYSGYRYFTGDENRLYEEAKELEAAGKIEEAHDKIMEALRLNPTNRKVIYYKAKLFFVVDSKSKLKNAISLRDDAVRAMDRGDYVTAAEKLDKANDTVYNISPKSEFYTQAEELQAQILKDAERLKREMPERYFNKASELASNGEYERAYNALSYVKEPTSKINKLKDDLAYKIGVDKMAEIERDGTPTLFLIRDTIGWFNAVSDTSPHKIDAKVNISKLNKKLREIENKQ